MDKHREDRKNMKAFWNKHGERCMTIRSIDAVYEEYLKYLKENNITSTINRYIFRTYIRKNGYCNSGVEMKVKEKKQKKEKKVKIRVVEKNGEYVLKDTSLSGNNNNTNQINNEN